MESMLGLRLRWNAEWKKVIALVLAFLTFYFMPLQSGKVVEALVAGLALLQDYARRHVLTCLVPAFFIAGAIAVFVRKDSILKLLGPTAKKYIAYPIASVSGGILAVCSCTILPLFAGIYKRGALMYFATLTEVPIIQTLMKMGMARGPALTLFLTGNSLSIPSIIVLVQLMGRKQALTYIGLICGFSVLAGMLFGSL